MISHKNQPSIEHLPKINMGTPDQRILIMQV